MILKENLFWCLFSPNFFNPKFQACIRFISETSDIGDLPQYWNSVEGFRKRRSKYALINSQVFLPYYRAYQKKCPLVSLIVVLRDIFFGTPCSLGIFCGSYFQNFFIVRNLLMHFSNIFPRMCRWFTSRRSWMCWLRWLGGGWGGKTSGSVGQSGRG